MLDGVTADHVIHAGAELRRNDLFDRLPLPDDVDVLDIHAHLLHRLGGMVRGDAAELLAVGEVDDDRVPAVLLRRHRAEERADLDAACVGLVDAVEEDRAAVHGGGPWGASEENGEAAGQGGRGVGIGGVRRQRFSGGGSPPSAAAS